HYIGEDSAGHRYYEIQNTRQNVTRGYDPPPNNPKSEPGVEWQSWLKGTRRFPPSDDEIALNRMKEQNLQRNLTERKTSSTKACFLFSLILCLLLKDTVSTPRS
ncbi:hypothetical protein ANCDUO_24959, partial [Ancylostoma duodenale]